MTYLLEYSPEEGIPCTELEGKQNSWEGWEGEIEEVMQVDTDALSCLHRSDIQPTICPLSMHTNTCLWLLIEENVCFLPFQLPVMSVANHSKNLLGKRAWEMYFLDSQALKYGRILFLNFLIKIFEILFIPILCIEFYVHVPWACSTQSGQKRLLAFLGL